MDMDEHGVAVDIKQKLSARGPWLLLSAALVVSTSGGQICDGRPPDPGDAVDCGVLGSTEGTCRAAGCCWAPVDPNPDNLSWCFGCRFTHQ